MTVPKLKYVSITGADDVVAIADLNAIGAEYPFVEWAVLWLPEQAGKSRCPSLAWIENFIATCEGAHKALHLCGSAFLGFSQNKPDVMRMMKGFNRIQLNLEFGNVEGKYDLAAMLSQIRAHPEFEFIIQYTDRRRDLLPLLKDIPHHAILFDQSAGRGIAPDSWPAPINGHFCGYAGGINPDNIAGNIEKIAKESGSAQIWVDMESGVRTNDRFDLAKVRRVLELSKPFTL